MFVKRKTLNYPKQSMEKQQEHKRLKHNFGKALRKKQKRDKKLIINNGPQSTPNVKNARLKTKKLKVNS